MSLHECTGRLSATGLARLDEVATLLGFPGKIGMDGNKVWEHYPAGGVEGIRNYCETDVLITYLVYQRFELIRGHISAAQYAQACEQLSTEMEKAYKPHLGEFLQHWQG